MIHEQRDAKVSCTEPATLSNILSRKLGFWLHLNAIVDIHT